MIDTPPGRGLGWLLAKVADGDVQRDQQYRYRVYVTGNRPDDTSDYTDHIETLAVETRDGRGNWTPPLVRLLPNGLVELTVAGEEKLAAERTLTAKHTARQTVRRQATVPVFQPAAA